MTSLPCYVSTIEDFLMAINLSKRSPFGDCAPGESTTTALKVEKPVKLLGVIVASGWKIVSLSLNSPESKHSQSFQLRPAANGEVPSSRGTTFMCTTPFEVLPSQELVLQLRNVSGKSKEIVDVTIKCAHEPAASYIH